MRIAVTGAGTLGSALTSRLATTSFTTSLAWLNRDEAKVAAGAIDIQHGLAFAPTCSAVEAYPLRQLNHALTHADALVLTHGGGVPPGGTRAALYSKNGSVFRDSVIEGLCDFEGIVLVVTNPVDLLARLIHREARLPWQRVIGLGTEVETARLRWALATYLIPPRRAADVWAYAVGTHDEHFVPVFPSPLGAGAERSLNAQQAVLDLARAEVVDGARRVKERSRDATAGPTRGTMHPVVEGIVSVLSTIAQDQGRLHTVSVLDPTDSDQLFYSMPCVLDRRGVRTRLDDDEAEAVAAAGLETCRAHLRDVLITAGELDEGPRSHVVRSR